MRWVRTYIGCTVLAAIRSTAHIPLLHKRIALSCKFKKYRAVPHQAEDRFCSHKQADWASLTGLPSLFFSVYRVFFIGEPQG